MRFLFFLPPLLWTWLGENPAVRLSCMFVWWAKILPVSRQVPLLAFRSPLKLFGKAGSPGSFMFELESILMITWSMKEIQIYLIEIRWPSLFNFEFEWRLFTSFERKKEKKGWGWEHAKLNQDSFTRMNLLRSEAQYTMRHGQLVKFKSRSSSINTRVRVISKLMIKSVSHWFNGHEFRHVQSCPVSYLDGKIPMN